LLLGKVLGLSRAALIAHDGDRRGGSTASAYAA
jgi:hypothetical protein